MAASNREEDAFKAFPYEEMPSLPLPDTSLGLEKERKESKKEAKRTAYEAALKNGPHVSGLIFNPYTPTNSIAMSTTSDEIPVTAPSSPLLEAAAGAPPEPTEEQKPAVGLGLVEESDHEEQPDIDDAAFLEEALRYWTYDRLMEYIIENNLLLTPEEKIAARSHLADKKRMSTLLDKVGAAAQGGEMPTDKEIAEAEEILERKGKSIINPEDWSKDSFLEIIGLIGSKDEEDSASDLEYERGEEMVQQMEFLDLGVTSSTADTVDGDKIPQPMEGSGLEADSCETGPVDEGTEEMPTLEVLAVDQPEMSVFEEAVSGEKEVDAEESTEEGGLGSVRTRDHMEKLSSTLQPVIDGTFFPTPRIPLGYWPRDGGQILQTP